MTWCDACGQDVPFVAAPGENTRRCACCGEVLTPKSESPRERAEEAKSEAPRKAANETAEKARQHPGKTARGESSHGGSSQGAARGESTLDSLNDWVLEDQLRHVERLVTGCLQDPDRKSGHHAQPPEAASRHPAAESLPAWSLPGVQLDAAPKSKPKRSRFAAAVAWSSLSLGIMALACGAVLMGWSYWGGRPELWAIGVPFALGGQVGLLIGLVMQIERLWSDYRQNTEKLDQVDLRIVDLDHRARLLGTVNGSASQTFYAHLAEGASPKILLADLKGQLDLLAVRMSEQSRSRSC